jgi:hypothetical protein
MKPLQLDSIKFRKLTYLIGGALIQYLIKLIFLVAKPSIVNEEKNDYSEEESNNTDKYNGANDEDNGANDDYYQYGSAESIAW